MPKTNLADVKSRLLLVQLGLMAAFIIVALTLVYWSVIRAPSILVRGDNPRQVDAALNTLRGRILDVNGLTLAETRSTEGELVRQYASSGTGPIVGYYSFRHGTAGIEGGFDQLLSGERDDAWSEFWSNDVLHQPREGQDIRLTLDSRWQKRIEALLEEEYGAGIMFSLSDMGILSMASNPSYDPNSLDEQFSTLISDETAPLLNRATQGQYQPGFMLQPFILASLASAEIIDLESQLTGVEEIVTVNDLETDCKLPPSEMVTWAEMIVYQCPAPLRNLSGRLNADEIANMFEEFGFFSVPEIPIESEFSDNSAVINSDMALIGQDELAVSPIQIALLAASLANNGVLRQPELIAAVQDANGRWITQKMSEKGERIFDESVANLILSSLPEENGILEYSSLVQSGSEETFNAWYMGFAPSGSPKYGVVIILENKEDLSSVESIGRSLLSELPLANE